MLLLVLATAFVFLQDRALAMSLREHLLASLSANATTSETSDTDVARVLFGSGANSGINSTGVITHAIPHFNTTTLEIALTYAYLPNIPTTACNQLDVLLESRDKLVPEIHCIKHDEYITGIWMFTKENLASLRFP
ncbi:hypothetical protein BASA81_013278 [Batrachochytrium salamandrivorans]|nr:hypothetical protein BASA81_013278 [Batrachochytrium salamandrivorans]